MHNLTRKDAEPSGDRELAVVVDSFLPSLVIWIGEDWVLAFLEESKRTGVWRFPIV